MVGTKPAPGIIVPAWRGGRGSQGSSGSPAAPVTSPAPVQPSVGDIAAPSGVVWLPFGTANLAASLASSQLWNVIPGSAATFVQIGVPMLYRGSVLGMVLLATAAPTAGTATFEAYVEGSPSGARLVWTAATRACMAFRSGAYGFGANQSLDVRVSTTSTFAPTTTDVAVFLIVSFIPE